MKKCGDGGLLNFCAVLTFDFFAVFAVLRCSRPSNAQLSNNWHRHLDERCLQQFNALQCFVSIFQARY